MKMYISMCNGSAVCPPNQKICGFPSASGRIRSAHITGLALPSA